MNGSAAWACGRMGRKGSGGGWLDPECLRLRPPAWWKISTGALRVLIVLVAVAGFGIAIYGGYTIIAGVDWQAPWAIVLLLFRAVVVIFAWAAVMIATVAVMGALAGLGWILGRLARGQMRRRFLAAVGSEFGGDPVLAHDRVGFPDADFFALDTHQGAVFACGSSFGWEVTRLPLGIVSRYELVRDTQTSTTVKDRFGGLRLIRRSTSAHSVRLHYLDSARRPGSLVIPFGGDERQAQAWITAIGG